MSKQDNVNKTEELKPKNNIFNTMGVIFTKEEYPDEQAINKIVPYQLNQWLSSTPNAIKTAHFLNVANKLPKDIQFKFAYHTVPKSFRPKFPKKTKNSEQYEFDIDMLMYKYKCNIDTAKYYFLALIPLFYLHYLVYSSKSF